MSILLFKLNFTWASSLGLIACLIVGLAYAWLLYNRPSDLSTGLKKALFAFRAFVVALMAFLLFAPLVQLSEKSLEKPLLILAQDRSASIGLVQAPGFDSAVYHKQFKAIEEELKGEYDVRSLSFGHEVSNGLDFRYTANATNIAGLFNYIDQQFSNRNIGAVILASDGIYNAGANPVYEARNIPATVYAIALGDTIPKKDLVVANINYNNLVYLDNDFQLQVDVEAFKSRGSATTLHVEVDGARVFSKSIRVNSDEFRQTVPVTLHAGKKGIQRYRVSVSAVSGELSTENNTQTIFIEVIDGRKKVLIVAASPHPDISAIKQSIEQNKNYEVKQVLSDEVSQEQLGEADLLILHQIPSLLDPARNILRVTTTKPSLFILGAQSNTTLFSSSQNMLTISATGSTQESLAKVNPGFTSFVLSQPAANTLQNLAPLVSPFGNYALKTQSSTLLQQQIGKIVTETPLLSFADNGSIRTGVLAGEGIWRWRLEEFKETGAHAAVDELLSKTAQYLAGKDDKRKFRVYSSLNTFDENERVIVNAELYNDAFELVNTPDATIAITGNNGRKFNYAFSRTGSSYILDAGLLPAGEYNYTANVTLGNQKHQAQGRFVVAKQQAELRQTTANHQLLHSLATQSNGKMLYPAELGTLVKLIKDNELVKTVVYEDKRYEDIVNLKTIFFILLALLSVEWLLRKRNGLT